MNRQWAVCMVALSTGVAAAEDKPKAMDPLGPEALWRVFGSLALILVAIFALVWVLRRSGSMIRGRGGKMQVVDVLSLGQRERLVLVAVGDQQIVLGVAPGRVQAVHTIDSPYEAAPAAGNARFADVLRRAETAKNISVEKLNRNEEADRV